MASQNRKSVTSSNEKTMLRDSSQNKSHKKHTIFRPSYHHGTQYLKKTIVQSQTDSTRFSCILCKEKYKRECGGYFENLRVHLQSKNHLKSLKNETLTLENSQALDFLEKHQETGLPVRIEEEKIDEESLYAQRNPDLLKSIPDHVLLKFEMTRFLIKHNLPFTLGEHIINFFQYISNEFDQTTIGTTAIYPKQISHIAKNCLLK